MAKIFYSWMSDGDDSLNRYFIWDCLGRAIRLLNRERGIEAYEVVRDTQGAQGAVDIVAEIFRRIDASDLIVADVTNIAANSSGELVPNPNVMFEFGYALARKGEKALIAIANTAHGGPESLPFDINKRVIMTYELRDRTERAKVREQLVPALAAAIKANLGEQRSERITRHSAGFFALIELLIGETDLPHLPDAQLLPRAARALELAREVGRNLHDIMNRPFAGFVVKTIEYLEQALRMTPTDENLPKIRNLLFWAFDDIELGSRDARQNDLRMDEAGLESGLAALRELAGWFRDCAARAADVGAGEMSSDELAAYEKKTFALRRLSFLGLVPSHPGFTEKLVAHSVAIRKDFFTLTAKSGTNVAATARSAADALDALFAAYGV